MKTRMTFPITDPRIHFRERLKKKTFKEQRKYLLTITTKQQHNEHYRTSWYKDEKQAWYWLEKICFKFKQRRSLCRSWVWNLVSYAENKRLTEVIWTHCTEEKVSKLEVPFLFSTPKSMRTKWTGWNKKRMYNSEQKILIRHYLGNQASIRKKIP